MTRCEQTGRRGNLRVNDTASDGNTFHQAQLFRRLFRKSLTNRLTGSEDETVLAGDATELSKVVLDHVTEA